MQNLRTKQNNFDTYKNSVNFYTYMSFYFSPNVRQAG